MKASKRRMMRAVLSGALCLATLLVPAVAADAPAIRTSLDQGFRLLYDLDFDQAHQVFLNWQHDHPQDPVGPTAEAAGRDGDSTREVHAARMSSGLPTPPRYPISASARSCPR